MSDPALRQELIDLFRETGPAHHRAFSETNGVDPEWPLWYAQYLQPKVSCFSNVSITQSKLVQLLVSASEEHEKNAPGSDWTEFYADFFLENMPKPA